MGGLVSRRWLRRLVIVTALAGAAAAFREWKLDQNAKRFGLPS